MFAVIHNIDKTVLDRRAGALRERVVAAGIALVLGAGVIGAGFIAQPTVQHAQAQPAAPAYVQIANR